MDRINLSFFYNKQQWLLYVTMDNHIISELMFKYIVVADREGFEPSVILRLRILSRDVVSANSPTCPFCIPTGTSFESGVNKGEIISNKNLNFN